MTVLVTGGLGAIGSWVTRQLAERDEPVVVYDTLGDERLVADVRQRITVETGDILDVASLHRAIHRHGARRVVHLAAVLFGANADPRRALLVNTLGTVNVLEAARIFGLDRVVFTSSKAVYRLFDGTHGHPTYEPVPEGYPLDPQNAYGATKLAAEAMVSQYRRLFAIDALVLRLAATYGPGKLVRHGPTSLHSRLIETAIAGGRLSVPRGGDEGDDLIYNRDVAHAIVAALDAPRPAHQLFNVGTGRITTLHGLAQTLTDRYPRSRIEVGPGLDPMDLGPGAHYGALDVNRADEELGFRARYDLAGGVADYAETLARLRLQPLAG